ncbi:ELMO domain-containing protein 3-like isoform X1 [Schistocerca cancellata]|uniref:ELMO domain-containing protein 3-like isoform X1 n=1 Tax=Schistocerca cancellata TaxID=274614 RepID=UPI0021188242|nr:ELMO domain-containing protein 3-like isoform X1 [Schistocerca cancellata]
MPASDGNGNKSDLDITSAFAWHRLNATPEKERFAVESARREWDGIATVEPMYQLNTYPLSHLTFQQALTYFQRLCSAQKTENVIVEVERKGLCTLLSCLVGPPQLDEHLSSERELVFAISKCKLDVRDATHIRILQTVYYRFTGANLGCPCYGVHWEHIGFQITYLHPYRTEGSVPTALRVTSDQLKGSDPGSDLRGVGMLGMLQLLYLSSNPKLSSLARHIYRVSTDTTHSFPLAVLSFNLTRVALQALRHGQLNRECNERQQVFDVVNEFYAAIFFHLLQVWTTQHKTIKDSGFVLKDVEWFCRSNVRLVLKNLQAHVKAASESSIEKLSYLESFHDLRSQAKTEVFI